MIILKSHKNCSLCVRDTDLFNGIKKFYIMYANGYYDPDDNYRPCFGGTGDVRRRLNNIFVEDCVEGFTDAEECFDKVKEAYDRKIEAMASKNAPAPTPVAPAPTVTATGGLGLQLESIMLKVLAEQSVDKVLEVAKPVLESHIRETYGVLPQVHTVVTPTATHTIKGVVHERFETVLNLVNADIPVFLTGAAGTGKNVLCKQIAESLNLEFYFSNAVTQEYKLTGFIDANGTFHETQFYKAFTEGGLFMLDEMDASIPEVLIILNAAIANRYFDFPTGRVEAHENFRLIAAGNTFGTGADMEYTGRFQLDAASLDRFALVEINYSPAIEEAIANGDAELVEFIRGFRTAVALAGIKHLATYRSIERIRKLTDIMDTKEVLKMALVKNLEPDDIKIIASSMTTVSRSNKYLTALNALAC